MKKQIQRVMLLGCSNGISQQQNSIQTLCCTLEREFGIHPEISEAMYQTKDGLTQSPQTRAQALQNAFLRSDIDAIFDLSGGDAANALLPFLNFEVIRHNPKPFFGYSDLSVLLNPLHERSNLPVFYFQARFLTKSAACRAHLMTMLSDAKRCVPQHYTFLQGHALSGTIAGGNIRCTLKLIGTPWQPNFRNKILFLESLSGGLPRIETMLWQYRHIGAFAQCNGILLGNFTELADHHMLPQLYTLICDIADTPSLPIVCTTEIGHQPDSLCLPYHILIQLQRQNLNQ